MRPSADFSAPGVRGGFDGRSALEGYNRAMRLTREIRFFPSARRDAMASADSNHWAGTAANLQVPFWSVRVCLEGRPDPATGYLFDIKALDEWVRSLASEGHFTQPHPPGPDDVAAMARGAFQEISGRLPRELSLSFLRVALSPHTSVSACRGVPPVLQLTQSFEFSASHRLAGPGLSDEENRRLFGKCSNPHGHGHNYVVEVTIAAGLTAQTAAGLVRLDRVVQSEIIERFDHKNLNVECAEFATLNPTVENIAQVIFDRLAMPLGASLARVCVWETPKTCAECTSASRSPAAHRR
jgi:6-pyruvoyltetrahydropterin/6-carboxytetrahydropterin synthase